MKCVAIIQARMSSSRLPGKVLLPLADKPVIQWVVDAAKAIHTIDQLVVATSHERCDDILAEYCQQHAIACYRGDLDDVLQRYVDAARHYDADIILRLTADCPLIDPHLCEETLALLLRGKYDYTSNALNPTYPDGLDCEAFTRDALERAGSEAKRSLFREHVTSYFHHHRHMFRLGSLNAPLPGLHKYRWTLDTPADYDFLSALAPHLPSERPASYTEILQLMDQHPEWYELNQSQTRNEGLAHSLKAERYEMSNHYSFHQSHAMLRQAETRIPLGSQTFSKSKTAYNPGFAPLFATHGAAGRIWDVDGNCYVDLVNGLMPNILGYADPEVDFAVRQQLNHGVTLSLATQLEYQLAERLVHHIPCAEKVRFGKNGSDATSGCVRLARAYTGKDHIISCGYHGWQDWSIGTTTRNKGVPEATSALTHAVAYNDLQAVESILKTHQGRVAALIMEPMNFEWPQEGYLAELKQLLHRHDTLLIFDEVWSGFRFHMGGAGAYFGVKPDLAAFGKAMANGLPLSAIVGRADIMNEMEEVFFSGTFGGETLSLAAAITVIDKMQREDVIDSLWRYGQTLRSGIQAYIEQHGLEQIVTLKGADICTLLSFSAYKANAPHVLKSYLTHALYARGVLTLGTHNHCYAHNEDDKQWVLHAYDGALAQMAEDLARSDCLQTLMPMPVIEPLFSVRNVS